MSEFGATRSTGSARRIIQNFSLLFGAILLVLAFAECGLRWKDSGTILRLRSERSLRIPHPVRGWTLEPGGTAYWSEEDRSVSIRINEMGLRDRPHAHAPEPGVFRVVVIGDSFMEAYQVSLEESLPYLLQETLSDRRVEVINLGVGGYGTAQEYLHLRDEGLRYEPQLVVLAFFASNDVRDNSRRIHQLQTQKESLKSIGRPFAELLHENDELRWVLPDIDRVNRMRDRKLRKSQGFWNRLGRQLEFAMIMQRIERLGVIFLGRITGKPVNDPNISFISFVDEFVPELGNNDLSRADYVELWDDAWRITRRLILEADTLSRVNGSKFAVLIVPERLQVEQDFRALIEEQNPGIRLDPEKINVQLSELCESAGIPLLDLTPIFARSYAEEGRLLYHRLGDRHWNSAGHELATAELVRFLDRRGLLPATISQRQR